MDFKYRKWIYLILIAGFFVALDQVTKRMAARYLAEPVKGYYPPRCNPDGAVEERVMWRPTRRISVIDGYFDLVYAENCGGAFGLFASARESRRKPFFYISSIVASVLLLYLFFNLKKGEYTLLAAFSLILGGAIGNVFDRISLGYVIDFIDWHIKNKAHWPTFNVADAGITIGMILILIDSFFLAPKREKRKKAEGKRG